MNWDILGHEWAVDLLSGQIARGSLSHAYLFTGPTGVGRRTLALRFARAINCAAPPEPGLACGKCRACRGIAAQEHPDLVVVAAETVGGTLKVEQVRELGRFLSLAPYEARRRVALLLRFEEAQRHAANALLKTLEEPNDRVVLLLTAEGPEQVPQTILSRCQLIRLRPLPVREFEERLGPAWGVSPEQARLLAHLSGGRPGIARRFLEDPEAEAARMEVVEQHVRMITENRIIRFRFAEAAAKDRATLRDALEVWATYWRDVLIVSAGASTPLTHVDREGEIREVAGQVGVEAARRTLGAIERTRDRIDRNANTRLALETLMLELPRLGVK
jgi:DNA polymerase-3 subunit delta'